MTYLGVHCDVTAGFYYRSYHPQCLAENEMQFANLLLLDVYIYCCLFSVAACWSLPHISGRWVPVFMDCSII